MQLLQSAYRKSTKHFEITDAEDTPLSDELSENINRYALFTTNFNSTQYVFTIFIFTACIFMKTIEII